MNPHRHAWGFAYDMPFAQMVAIAMFIGILMTKEKLHFPLNRVTIVWLVFILWCLVATIFAINMSGALDELDRFVKIQIVTACSLLLLTSRDRIIQLVWVIVVSIGFYGFKGGIHSIITGMSGRVSGPPGSFIEGNNELGLALLMIVPLIYFLILHTEKKYVWWFLWLMIGLCIAAVIGTFSRGAFLAGMVTLFFLWLGMKAKTKVIIAGVMATAIIVSLPMIPDSWFDRMDTIETYEEDGSAMGRINAWHFAFNLANDRPLTGGGFRAFTPDAFYLYAPDPEDHHDAHSIYFEVLGELGWVGLFLFLLLWLLMHLEARYIKMKTKNDSEKKWMGDLALMCQVSLIAYLTGGAFLGLAFFDLPYHIMALIVVTGVIMRNSMKSEGGNAISRI